MTLIVILALMCCGILIGAVVFSRLKSGRWLKLTGGLQQVATTVLLLAMGVWLGSNPSFWENLAVIGYSGFLFAILGILGSIAVLFLLSRTVFRGEWK